MSAADHSAGRDKPPAAPAAGWLAPQPLASLHDDEFGLLLDGLAQEAPGQSSALRLRLLDRVRRSAEAGRSMFTRRHRDMVPSRPRAGVELRTLYEATSRDRRLGEPQRVRLVQLAPGARWSLPQADLGLQRDWLVMQGSVRLGDLTLAAEDFHLQPAGAPCPVLRTDIGALLLLREAALPARPDEGLLTQRARGAEWSDYGPGIQRRVMWQREGQAAMLYRTIAGAAVPRHAHGHDEECLMLEGDLFLDEVLLRPLDYQLAPAGTSHQGVSTDTGVLLYAHGDLDLAIQQD